MQDVYAHIDAHTLEYVERLRTLCRQPSIAASGQGIAEAAALVLDMVKAVGATAELVPVPGGPPVVYGEIAGQGRRVLSLYNHYDVQPADPLDLWHSDPFGAEMMDGLMYARGVADNKGDLVARLCAVQSYLAVRKTLPLKKLKFIFEGEEEVGSPHLGQFAEAHQDIIAADGCIWEGGSRDSEGRPEIMLGLKGIAYVELTATAANMDVHSMWAPIVPNGAWRLVWALNTLKDKNERVLIPGFYDKVRPPTAAELDILQPMGDEAMLKQWALPSFLGGKTGKDLAAQLIFQPTCTICGIWGGFIDKGVKTVLPNKASAKIDFRLVPDQTPEEVAALLRTHLDAQGFPDIEVKLLGRLYPAKTSLDSHLAKVLIKTSAEVYGTSPVVLPAMPGSGPMYQLCQKYGVPAGSTGVANANSRYHAPNENISIADFMLGIKHAAAIIDAF